MEVGGGGATQAGVSGSHPLNRHRQRCSTAGCPFGGDESVQRWLALAESGRESREPALNSNRSERSTIRLYDKLTVFQGGDAKLANFNREGFLKTLQEGEEFGACGEGITSSCKTRISANQPVYYMYTVQREQGSPWKKRKTL
jgi:hypothetical protein